MLINQPLNNFQSTARKTIIVILLAFTIFPIAGCFENNDYQQVVIAEVAGEKLLAGTFAKNLSNELKNYDILSAKNNTYINQAKKRVLKNFLLQTIIKKWAEKTNTTVTSLEINNEINNIRSQYPNDAAFRKNLLNENISLNDFRKRTRTTLLQKMVLKKINSSISKPNQKEIENYYKKNSDEFKNKDLVKIQQIVVKTKDSAERLRKELLTGAKIPELAKEFSITPEGKNGGDTGWVAPNTLNVFKRAHRMPLHSISKVTESSFGFHVFTVLGKKNKGEMSLSEATEKITQHLTELREQASYSAWLDDQLKKYRYYKNNEALAAISVSASK